MIQKLIQKLKQLYRAIHFNLYATAQQKLQKKRCEPWFKARGDETLRLNYTLNEHSIVFDLGGYKGEWTEDIQKKYNCFVFIFEPIQTFFEIIETKTKNNPKTNAFKFGLSNKNDTLKIIHSDNASSLFLPNTHNKNTETIELVQAKQFFEEQNIQHIDLMKINIEGGEYDLLEHLLAENLVSKINNLQIQFHDFLFEDGETRMKNIQKQLNKTHELTYQFEFVWENWQLKKH